MPVRSDNKAYLSRNVAQQAVVQAPEPKPAPLQVEEHAIVAQQAAKAQDSEPMDGAPQVEESENDVEQHKVDRHQPERYVTCRICGEKLIYIPESVAQHMRLLHDPSYTPPDADVHQNKK